MNPHEERDQRWIAYHLGDLSEGARAKVEAELREDPEKAIQFKALIEGIERCVQLIVRRRLGRLTLIVVSDPLIGKGLT